MCPSERRLQGDHSAVCMTAEKATHKTPKKKKKQNDKLAVTKVERGVSVHVYGARTNFNVSSHQEPNFSEKPWKRLVGHSQVPASDTGVCRISRIQTEG